MKKLIYVLGSLIVAALVFLNVFCTPFVRDEGTGADVVLLTVQVSGTGIGRVTSSPPGIDSTATSSCLFPADTVVILQARTSNGSGSYFRGWSGAGSGSFRDVTLTLDSPQTVTAEFDTMMANLAFVTSTLHPADLGSLAAYDGICNTLATSAGINNTAGNAYKAWMSTEAAHEARTTLLHLS